MRNWKIIALYEFVVLLTCVQEYLASSLGKEADTVVVNGKELSSLEMDVVNRAKEEIAHKVEKNLLRLFAAITAHNARQPRQDYYDYDDDDIVTPDPTVIPQVAQILGAIFSGGLNITRVADQTVGLIPTIIRTQLEGIMKVLTGQRPLFPSLRTTPRPVRRRVRTTENAATQAITTVPASSAAPPTSEASAGYKVKPKVKTPTTTSQKPLKVIDDELEDLEDYLEAEGRAYQSYVADKPPRYFAKAFDYILKNSDLESPDIAQAVPSLFQGTEQYFSILRDLGVVKNQ